MQMYRFGRKFKLPSTIAIKHQIRKLMAEDEVKKAAAESRVESPDILQRNTDAERQNRHLGSLEGSLVK
jgi:hypothetical protein